MAELAELAGPAGLEQEQACNESQPEKHAHACQRQSNESNIVCLSAGNSIRLSGNLQGLIGGFNGLSSAVPNPNGMHEENIYHQR
jgi:hypothetical protein